MKMRRRANARNVRLYYPYWQYTDHFIFRFVTDCNHNYLQATRFTNYFIYLHTSFLNRSIILITGYLTDVNECNDQNTCTPSAQCENLIGSHRCIETVNCPQGFTVDETGRQCEGNECSNLLDY